jgi:hypothetical protein
MEYLIYGIILVLYLLNIRYCYQVAKKLGRNVYLAVTLSIVWPPISLLYNHWSYRDKKGSDPSGKGGQIVKWAFLFFLVLMVLLAIFFN